MRRRRYEQEQAVSVFDLEQESFGICTVFAKLVNVKKVYWVYDFGLPFLPAYGISPSVGTPIRTGLIHKIQGEISADMAWFFYMMCKEYFVSHARVVSITFLDQRSVQVGFDHGLNFLVGSLLLHPEGDTHVHPVDKVQVGQGDPAALPGDRPVFAGLQIHRAKFPNEL